jgi:hypothetical protein
MDKATAESAKIAQKRALEELKKEFTEKGTEPQKKPTPAKKYGSGGYGRAR